MVFELYTDQLQIFNYLTCIVLKLLHHLFAYRDKNSSPVVLIRGKF